MADPARLRRGRLNRVLTQNKVRSATRKTGAVVASLFVVFGTAFGSGAFATGGELSEPTATVSETIVEETVENQPAQEQTQTSQEPASQESEQAPEPAEKKSDKPAKSAKPAKPEVPAPNQSASAPAGPVDGPQSRMQAKANSTPAPLPNPGLPEKCGLNIALVFDLSNSLSDSDITASKAAGIDFVNTLEGTPTRVGVYSFASLAPAPNNTNLGSTSIAAAADAATVRAKINSLQRPPSSRGGTNWDRGLAQIPAGYDMVLFITDGNPTAYGNPADPGNGDWGTQFDQIDIDTAIAAANGLKTSGTFVMGIGVGNLTVANLEHVSGTTEGTDYYRIANYGQLREKLKEIGLRHCAGTVTVNKKVKDLNGNLSDAPGWVFSATDDSNVSPASGTTDANGLVNFKVEELNWNENRTVEIAETLQTGYELEKQDGKNAVCVDRNNNDAPVTVTDSGDLGFMVDVKGNANQVVTCTVINTVKAKPLTVKKTAAASYHTKYEWGIEKDVDETSFTIDEGDANPKANYTVTVTEGDKVDSGAQGLRQDHRDQPQHGGRHRGDRHRSAGSGRLLHG